MTLQQECFVACDSVTPCFVGFRLTAMGRHLVVLQALVGLGATGERAGNLWR